jgi:hypothetical protein
MECVELVHDTGVSSSDAYEGSYCIPKGTRYDPLSPPDATECTVDDANCGDPRPY